MLLYSTLIKLLESFIDILTAILSLEVLQVFLSSCKFKSKEVAISFTAILI